MLCLFEKNTCFRTVFWTRTGGKWDRLIHTVCRHLSQFDVLETQVCCLYHPSIHPQGTFVVVFQFPMAWAFTLLSVFLLGDCWGFDCAFFPRIDLSFMMLTSNNTADCACFSAVWPLSLKKKKKGNETKTTPHLHRLDWSCRANGSRVSLYSTHLENDIPSTVVCMQACSHVLTFLSSSFHTCSAFLLRHTTRNPIDCCVLRPNVYYRSCDVE